MHVSVILDTQEYTMDDMHVSVTDMHVSVILDTQEYTMDRLEQGKVSELECMVSTLRRSLTPRDDDMI